MLIKVAENMPSHIAANVAQWHRERANSKDVAPEDRERHKQIAALAAKQIKD